MFHLKRTLLIDATPDEVWAVLSRYMHIYEFAPLVASTDALTDGDDGIGSTRRNNFENGTYMVEEVTDWKPGMGYTIKAIEMPSMPLKEAIAGIHITQSGGRSKVVWTYGYRVKYGPLGWLMGQTMMKMMMRKVIDATLKGLADKVQSNQMA